MSGPAFARIDGRAVTPRDGESVLDAARRLGIEIPALCTAPGLPVEGGCRLCLVETGGGRTRAACQTPLDAGMDVVTESPRLAALRRDLLALVVGALPGRRLRADPAGSEVGRWMERLGVEGSPLARRQGVAPPVDARHPYLRFDPGRCIVCRRCLAACESVQGQFVYGIAGRGADVRLLIGADDSWQGSDCTSCGACVDACPSGAVTDRDRLDGAVAEAVTDSVCGYCGVGCRIRVESAGGRVLRISGVPEAAVNRGHLCSKGRYAHGYLEAEDRLTRPLLRRGGQLEPVSWEEAIGWLARRLVEVRDDRGPDALGVMTSSRSTNEAAYLLQKLFRAVLGTNNVDCCARVCHASTALALQRVTGTGAASASYDDIERARAIVVAGANPTEAHPVVGARIKQAALAGVPLVVIDPRRIELAAYAVEHLQLAAGTNVALFNGLAKVLVEEGLVDRGEIAERLEGWEELEGHLAGVDLEEVAAVTGVAASRIRAAARVIGGGPTLFVHGLGLSELTQGTESVMALCNLGMLTASIGRPGAGMLPLRGQNNVQGNADMGGMPNQTTGYEPLADPEVQARLAELWGTPPPTEPGLTVTEMVEAAAAGEVAALWIQGEDIAQSDPHQQRVIEALDRLELLVVQELFLTETARRAHLVLPAASYLEQDGTFTNGERRIQRVRRAVDPPAEARPDWEVAVDVAHALGADWRYAGPGDVLAEIAHAAPRLFGGVSWERLGADGLQWPCPRPDHPGTGTVHAGGYLRGRGLLSALDHRPPPEDAVPGYPFRLTTGRVLQHYNVGTMTRRTPHAELVGGDDLEIHPADAARLGLADGDRVVVESRWGETEVAARTSERVAPGSLFLSFHFPGSHTNRLVGPHHDPESKCPDYKVVAVRVRRAVSVSP